MNRTSAASPDSAVESGAVHALVVAQPEAHATLAQALGKHGLTIGGLLSDPYAAIAELCRRPGVYRTIVLSLQTLYTEELEVIAAIRARFPQVEVYLAHSDTREASLAQALRLGATGLLSSDGLHAVAPAAPSGGRTSASAVTQPANGSDGASPSTKSSQPPAPELALADEPPPVARLHLSPDPSEPLLTAEELRALLEDEPAAPGGAS